MSDLYKQNIGSSIVYVLPDIASLVSLDLHSVKEELVSAWNVMRDVAERSNKEFFLISFACDKLVKEKIDKLIVVLAEFINAILVYLHISEGACLQLVDISLAKLERINRYGLIIVIDKGSVVSCA